MTNTTPTAIEAIKSKMHEVAVAIDRTEGDMRDNAILEIFGIFKDIEDKMNSIIGLSSMLLTTNTLKGHVLNDIQLMRKETACATFSIDETDAICRLKESAQLIYNTAVTASEHLSKIHR